MKAFVALCLVVVMASAAMADLLTSPEQIAKLSEFKKECLETSKVDPELIIKARSGVFSDEPKADEFYTCMFKKLNFVDADGHIVIKNIEEKTNNVGKEEFDKLVGACDGEVKKAPKDKVAKVTYECFITKTGGKYQLFPESA